MKVMISWSGEQSKHVATALRTWLRDVIQCVEPWMSEADIGAGERWNQKVDDALKETHFGIVCLTKDTVNQPWILFESGALAKQVSESFVCPYLIDMQVEDIPSGQPLTKFQAKKADKKGTLAILEQLNVSLKKEDRLDKGLLERSFERCWPDLAKAIGAMPKSSAPKAPERNERDILSEILELVRELHRKQPPVSYLGPSLISGLNLDYGPGNEVFPPWPTSKGSILLAGPSVQGSPVILAPKDISVPTPQSSKDDKKKDEKGA